ncbi:hatching enzyme 1.2-like [Argopecten irradians]|uniref:hatching enzyme 1.2-like n=1 Tax=Argopecten irradians TaxID=31199 RepID=UPI003719DEE1
MQTGLLLKVVAAVSLILQGSHATYLDPTTVKNRCKQLRDQQERELKPWKFMVKYQPCSHPLCHEENANPDIVEGDILCDDTPSHHRVLGTDGLVWDPAIKYIIESTFSSTERAFIENALTQLETKVNNGNPNCKFSLTLEKDDKEGIKNYSQTVRFVKGSGYFTAVGKRATYSEPHTITLGSVTHATNGSVLHELMHAMGFWHEHSRPDRNSTIEVHFDHVQKYRATNFIKLKPSEVKPEYSSIQYDPCSLMHYGPYAFTKDKNKKTITLWDSKSSMSCKMGQRNSATKQDILRIQKLFGCVQDTDKSDKKSGS